MFAEDKEPYSIVSRATIKGFSSHTDLTILGSCHVKAMYTRLDKACVVISTLGKLII